MSGEGEGEGVGQEGERRAGKEGGRVGQEGERRVNQEGKEEGVGRRGQARRGRGCSESIIYVRPFAVPAGGAKDSADMDVLIKSFSPRIWSQLV